MYYGQHSCDVIWIYVVLLKHRRHVGSIVIVIDCSCPTGHDGWDNPCALLTQLPLTNNPHFNTSPVNNFSSLLLIKSWSNLMYFIRFPSHYHLNLLLHQNFLSILRNRADIPDKITNSVTGCRDGFLQKFKFPNGKYLENNCESEFIMHMQTFIIRIICKTQPQCRANEAETPLPLKTTPQHIQEVRFRLSIWPPCRPSWKIYLWSLLGHLCSKRNEIWYVCRYYGAQHTGCFAIVLLGTLIWHLLFHNTESWKFLWPLLSHCLSYC